MYAYKFIIPSHEWRSDPAGSGLQWSGCGCVVLAGTEELARDRVTMWAAENGLDSRWLEVSDVKRVIPVPGAVLMWSQT